MAETWFTPKEWKARLVEFAGRRLLRNVANGESTTYDVSRSEGQVSQEGDAFNTKNMNDLEQRIADGFANAKTNIDKLNRDLKFPDGVGFYPDIQDGVRGYNTDPKRGADTFTPFKKAVNLGTGTRFDVSLYSNHKKFTADNFIIKIERVTTSQSPTDSDQDNGNAGVNISPTVSYDAEKGIVTVSRLEGIGRFKTYGSTGCIIKSKVEVSVWLIF